MTEATNIDENVGAIGYVRVKKYVAGTLAMVEPLASRYMEMVSEGDLVGAGVLLSNIEGILSRNFLGLATAGPNLIMQGALTGKDLFVQYLINGTTYTGGLNYGAIGTGSTAPAISNTQLGTETYRTAPSLLTDSGHNIAQLRFFMADANLANGTYYEFGTFINGTVSANSGQIFNRSLFGTPYVKTTGVDTTIEVDITLT